MKEVNTLTEISSPSEASDDRGQKTLIGSMSPGPAQSRRPTLRAVVMLVLCLTTLAVFVPLNPKMPAAGLDTSWMMAMNQAVAQHLVFGRDMVFTFGPYAAIYTELFHPATDRLMILGSSFVGLAYFFALLLLGKGHKPYLLPIYGFLLAGFVNSRDALLYSYPLAVGLVAYRLALPDHHEPKQAFPHSLERGVASLFTPLGFLPLIKVSLTPVCGAIALLSFALFWRRGKRMMACAVILVPIVSCALLWAASGQSILALPRFFLSTMQIISGYTEAMAFPGDPFECILYGLTSVLILVALAWKSKGPAISKIFLVGSYAAFLFLSFKAGFVRHDPWHNITASSAIVIAAFLLVFLLDAKRSAPLIAMAVIVWVYIGPGSFQRAPREAAVNFRGTFTSAIRGLQNRWTNGELRRDYEQHLTAIRSEFPIEALPGTTDIYSFNQSWLLASANVWSPRPIVQSYQVYTPELAELNRRHLEGANAPDNILFRVEPIDGRLPSLEDGSSWPALINGYSLMKLDSQTAYLRRRAKEPNSIPIPDSVLFTAWHKFGEEVPLPEANDPLFASLEISPTFLGKIVATAYKPPELHIALRLRDGQLLDYRTASNLMKPDFLLTPLVRNTEEFALLFAGGTKYLGRNQVKSVTVSADDPHERFWTSSYSLTLRRKTLTRNAVAETSVLFDPLSETAPPTLSAPSALKCQGSIEAINGNLPAAGITQISGALSLRGWMAVSAEDGIVPESVYVTLTSGSGKALYVQAHSTRREDIKQHFRHPEMPEPGYAALIDVSTLKGRYTLGLARIYQGNLGLCEQFNRPILIEP
jgi:hypothetical protein